VPREVATLLSCDVATMSLDQQRALLSWLDQVAPGQTQVVSTTNLELFPLVEHGTFLEALYYRLNTMRLDAPTHKLLGNDLAESPSPAIPTPG
jgi:transcriptional regulator of acetoin/glycerol metabolism